MDIVMYGFFFLSKLLPGILAVGQQIISRAFTMLPGRQRSIPFPHNHGVLRGFFIEPGTDPLGHKTRLFIEMDGRRVADPHLQGKGLHAHGIPTPQSLLQQRRGNPRLRQASSTTTLSISPSPDTLVTPQLPTTRPSTSATRYRLLRSAMSLEKSAADQGMEKALASMALSGSTSSCLSSRMTICLFPFSLCLALAQIYGLVVRRADHQPLGRIPGPQSRHTGRTLPV